ncbi:hypothetical protein UUU_43320 [Klebsiella pneumoniae subsp. pneumoniae DSM 30104 = JCM 1662 = NBRC 14940]|nr:hypothetical protein UUU_43320 [Klebsiella pneumoniae subsp. pneumoniae DSM 30104 = JCM 1662 = NBRC 14940]
MVKCCFSVASGMRVKSLQAPNTRLKSMSTITLPKSKI